MYGIAMYFLTAIGGYWVLERAESHKEGSLRRIGRVLGTIIILLSFISIGTSGWHGKRYYGAMHRGGYAAPQPLPPR